MERDPTERACPGAERVGARLRHLALSALVAFAPVLWGCSGQGVEIPGGREEAIVALFGSSWSEPVGPYRVLSATVEGSRVHVRMGGAGRRIALRLTHGDVAQWPLHADEVFEVRRPDRDLVVTVGCSPACGDEGAPLVALAERIVEAYEGRIFERTGQWVEGRESLVARSLSAALWLLAVLLAGALAWRRRRGFDRATAMDALLAAGMTVLVAGLVADWTPANWYTNVLPPRGWGGPLNEQNGVAGLVLQAGLRAALPWNEATLRLVQLALGGVAAAAALAAGRAMGVSRAAALLGAALCALLPQWARVVASDAPHVTVAALFFVLLWTWGRAQRPGHLLEAALALALIPLVALVRAEAVLLAALPPVLVTLRGSWRRTLALASAYGVTLLASAFAVKRLVVDRHGVPIPGWAERRDEAWALLTDPALLTQLMDPAAGTPTWFPTAVVVLLALGVVALAARRARLLVRLAVAFVLPQIALARLLNAEGMVGVRYFLPLLPMLAWVAAEPVAWAGEAARSLATRRGRPGAGIAAVWALALAAAGVVAWEAAPMYHHRYAFQDEHRFLVRELASVPGPLVVLYPAVRDDPAMERHPDCCLDPARGPLALALPHVEFRPLPLDATAPLPEPTGERTWFYESALCRLAPTAETERRNPGLAAVVRDACAAWTADPRLVEEARGDVSAEAMWRFFDEERLPVRLLRVEPGRNGAD